MNDIEGHAITLAESTNDHTLVTGASGEGKTTAAICLLNDITYDQGRKALVIDQSGSYTPREMKEHGATFLYEELDPCHGPVHFGVGAGRVGADRISAAIAEAADIRSFRQRAALKGACRAVMERDGVVSCSSLLSELNTRCKADKAKTIEPLLDHLSPLKELDTLTIGPEASTNKAPVTVLQLSRISPPARDMVVRFCLALLWEEIRQSGRVPPYDTLLLDELQNIPLTRGMAIWCMLREARKFRVQMILCTQSLSLYDRERLAMLTQAGQQLFFRPSMADVPLVDKLLGDDWHSVLSRLQRGQALLKGNYHLNGCCAIATTPLVVQFQKGESE